MWVIVYADNLLLVSPMEQLTERVFQSLSSKFHIKRIDSVCTYIGAQIEHDVLQKRLFFH